MDPSRLIPASMFYNVSHANEKQEEVTRSSSLGNAPMIPPTGSHPITARHCPDGERSELRSQALEGIK